MNTNLDKIALDLYGKIQTRFPSIKIGDENAEVLSKKSDIPKARFFEFEYEDNGVDLGTVAITLDEDDGIVVQVSGDLSDSNNRGAFKFIRSFRQFARNRLLNFDVQNIGKDSLDKRDYHFRAKPKEQPMMEPIMENKMYGTAKISYQDLGEARLVVKHTQPVNVDLAAGRTMHIESIYVENADGERFKYPFKHLGGARALAEHLKHGGNPYDSIGKHITSLSEELAQLRKFKGYVSRNEALSEAMGDINSKVMERIEQVKKEVHGLSRKAYYEQFAESFSEQENQMIPEEIMNDWIDRLTIRTFNEDLKTAFPYIFKLVDETQLPVREIAPEDMLSELSKETLKSYKGKAEKEADEYEKAGHAYDSDPDERDFAPSAFKKAEKRREGAKRAGEKIDQKDESFDPELAFENFMDRIEAEGIEQGRDTLFSPNRQVQQNAIGKLNKLFGAELQGGPDAINATASLKGIIDDPRFLASLDDVDGNLDIRPIIQQYVQQRDPEVALQLEFGTDDVGGTDLPDDSAGMPPPEEPAAPEAPQAAAPAPTEPAPVAEGNDEEDPPFDPDPPRKHPNATAGKHGQGYSSARHLARQGLKSAIAKAKKAGAKLDTTLDFGHKEMTLHDAIIECGMTPMECGFDTSEDQNGTEQMLKSVAGFWNSEAKNFTIGGTRVKTKLVKSFKDGEYPNASEEELAKVLSIIDKMDPSGDSSQQHDILRLAGVGSHSATVDEEMPDFAGMMKNMQGMSNTKFGDEELDVSNPSAMLGKINPFHPAYGPFAPKGTPTLPANTTTQTNPLGTGAFRPDSQGAQTPSGQINPADMIKQIMQKLNLGN